MQVLYSILKYEKYQYCTTVSWCSTKPFYFLHRMGNANGCNSVHVNCANAVHANGCSVVHADGCNGGLGQQHTAGGVGGAGGAGGQVPKPKGPKKPLTTMQKALMGIEFIAQHIKKADRDIEVRNSKSTLEDPP